MGDVLASFLPPVRAWFRATYAAPTPPQELGWPAIQRGEHVLILSPTGSGKTMAAFLWGINTILRDLAADPSLAGVQLLYVSPLKALNNDIERNLRAPLVGMRQVAHEMGQELPPLRVAVRTGDTPAAARQRMVRQPPHILITTPESLYLILTSPRAGEMLRTVKTVIVDEIHTLVGNKRGVHLALSLERLGLLTAAPPQRIGLSATQRPLDEVARFLGGQQWERDEQGQERLVSRPVTIVDAGLHKSLDLQVITPVPDLRRMPGNSIWPSLIPEVLSEIRRHRTTLIFTNSRRAAERAADRLNEQYALEAEEEVEPGSPAALLVDGVPKGQGFSGTGRVGGPFHAHHGSVSREVRLELEHKLKAGELPALVGTSSLELGIDIGSVDLVIQLQSPRSVSRGLQRVGRSGHLVGQTSKGRIYATYREDLLDAAAVAHGMLRGDIEPTYTPQNCLDVLAQQIVAMVAVQDWPVDALYRLVRQAYGYQRLPLAALQAVLEMLSGKFPSEDYRELRPRLIWDRVHNVLSALPGSRLLAIRNGGTIADRGEFQVVLADGKTTLGTLDEEFVFETRPGDVFTLGSSTWRALEIDEDKVVVADAGGSLPRMPFWKGEAPQRDYYSGVRLGAFRRALAERVTALPMLPDDPAVAWPPEAEPVIRWLQEEYALDERSARNAILYVRHQLDAIGAISTDRTIIVETFNDALGDGRLVIHSCFGGKVNSAWALALAHALRERVHGDVETQASDDGIIFRFLAADAEPPSALVRALGPDEARERLLAELPHSAVFGAQFRMNAARALLLPGVSGRRRTPFWLQRQRAKELLAVVRGFPDFPLIAETYRTCLTEVFDLEHLQELLAHIQEGQVRVVEVETVVPSPVAAGLLFDQIAVQMYEDDLPKAERQIQALAVHRELLAEILAEGALPDLLRPEAVTQVEEELQHLAEGYRARSTEELALMLHELGDLTADEVAARCLSEGRQWLLLLAAQGRALEVEIPTAAGPERRWIAAEDYSRQRDAWGLPAQPSSPLPAALLAPRLSVEQAWGALLRVLLRTHGPLTQGQILARYAFPLPWLEQELEELVRTGQVVSGRLSPGAVMREWCDRRVLERIHRQTLHLLRREIQPVDLPGYAEFLVRWQGLHPAGRRDGPGGLVATLQQLRGFLAPAILWERDLLPLRVEGFRPAHLDALCAEGDLVWVAAGGEARHARLRFLFRGEGGLFLGAEPAPEALSPEARAVWDFLRQEGACYAGDVRRGLGLPQATVDAALAELALAGVATNDQFTAMRRLLAGGVGAAEPRGLTSSLADELSAWRASHGPSTLRRPSPHRLREARREVGQRVAPPVAWGGRWSLVHRMGVWGPEVSAEERAERQARQLLQRYGVLARDLVAREEGCEDWAALYAPLQRMELRGEVRRGYFVRGFAGVQFALPEAVEALRAAARPTPEDAETLILLNACDPANLYGHAALGETPLEPDEDAGAAETPTPYRFARLPSNYIVLQRGVPILLYEHGGARWTTLPQMAEETARRAVQLLLEHLTREGGLCARPRRVWVRRWNGREPLGQPIQPFLEVIGFRREPPAMVWDGG
jgi:ATP-dependent Lhr-like helicase